MQRQGERLKQIRQELALTQEEFGTSLGISKQFYSNIETGKSLLNNEKLEILHRKYNVNLNYIIGGTGEHFLTSPKKKTGELILNSIEEKLKNNGLL